MRILKYSDHSKSIEMAEEFLNIIGSNIINESEDSYRSIIKKIVDDLKLNTSLVLTFGVGMTALFPLVNKLVSNMNLNIDMNIETVVLMTIAGVTIAYLEEKKQISNRKKLEKDSKSMLEELKLKGVGNGIIKKIVKCIQSIGNIFKILLKNKRQVFNGFFDMFSYVSLAIPIINAILYMVGKYNMNIDTLPSNFISLGLGVTTIAAKHGINYLIDLLKNKLKLSKSDILKNINDINDPMLKKYPHPEYIDTEYIDIDSKSKLIKEQ